MRTIRCESCGREAGLAGSGRYRGRTYCAACLEQLKQDPEVSLDEITLNIDATVCAHCGADNGTEELAAIEGLPACGACSERILRPAPPRWVRLFCLGVLAAVACGFIANAAYIGAYADYVGAKVAFLRGDAELAAERSVAAAAALPHLALLAQERDFFRAFYLLTQGDEPGALALLEAYTLYHPDNLLALYFRYQAEIGIAFDGGDYRRFYDCAHELADRFPPDPIILLNVASAAACLYVSGGEEGYLVECRAQIEAARRLRAEDNAAVFDEYVTRIEHRLASGEILSPEEYHDRLGGAEGE
jgi:DNA-directed RNA polymerase subunit RPC12/RpoP